jgi:uncharacterized LabA/DUF88 family protein
MRSVFQLKLRGKAVVFIDWANVYGWKKSLKKEVDLKKLFNYLKGYPEIKEINLYYGQDKHPKSKQLLKYAKRLGFRVVTKEVKYIPTGLDSSHFKNLAQKIKDSLSFINDHKIGDIEKILQILSRKILRRKCDFDIEISIDTHKAITDKFNTFIFFSGDGDFAPLYELLIKQKKQVIVVFAHGHLGKEVYQIKTGIFTRAVDRLGKNLFI